MDKDSPTPNRKRPRENETPSQRLKREKAAERQRRKRERDRQASGLPPSMPFPQDNHYPPHHHPQADYLTAPPPPKPEDNMSPEEQARLERLRANARERQRKHRLRVRQEKDRALGLAMGNEITTGIDDVHYRVNPDGHYQQVLAHDMQAQAQAAHAHAHHLQQQAAQAHAQGQPPPGEPPFPQDAPHGGQTFASTLLLSFACTPMLKQHLLSNLKMTNEELASLEPVIAEAWDRWDQGRRMRYEHPEGFPPPAVPLPGPPGSVPVPGPAAGAPPYPPYAAGPGDDFRGRFQRVMTVPAPFRSAFGGEGFGGGGGAEFAQNGNGGGEGDGGADTPSSGGGGSVAGGSDAIDPHLGAKEGEVKSEA
ncbi:hypothetical protein B0H11DRAFT_2034686 [Mycena galericulata]|nr:hypothetical protein B0H11DRAFT_2034686 [Mycena galericulata]